MPNTHAGQALGESGGGAIACLQVAIGVLVDPGVPAHPGGEGVRVLISRRKPGQTLGGYWELPGGKVEADETPAQAVVREFAEELGVTVAVMAELPTVEHDYPKGRIRLHPFLCRHVAGEPQNLQVAEHRWVHPRELGDYQFPQANASLIQRLQAML